MNSIIPKNECKYAQEKIKAKNYSVEDLNQNNDNDNDTDTDNEE